MKQTNSLVIVILAVVGAVLLYAAVKGEDPRDLIKNALGKGQK